MRLSICSCICIYTSDKLLQLSIKFPDQIWVKLKQESPKIMNEHVRTKWSRAPRIINSHVIENFHPKLVHCKQNILIMHAFQNWFHFVQFTIWNISNFADSKWISNTQFIYSSFYTSATIYQLQSVKQNTYEKYHNFSQNWAPMKNNQFNMTLTVSFSIDLYLTSLLYLGNGRQFFLLLDERNATTKGICMRENQRDETWVNWFR